LKSKRRLLQLPPYRKRATAWGYTPFPLSCSFLRVR